MDNEMLLQKLKAQREIIPDEYDGSYELVREIINSYRMVQDYSDITYKDLDAIYHMALGKWVTNSQSKIKKIKDTILPDDEKGRLAELVNSVWDKTCHQEYVHSYENGKLAFGMFGSGFQTFGDKISQAAVQQFIEMCVIISQFDETNSEKIYEKVEEVFKGISGGMKAASASVILHCLMPNVFPVLNGNSGNGTVYTHLNIGVSKPGELSNYISNCRKIRDFRDGNLSYKNYRVLDLVAREISELDDEYQPLLKDYDPNISTEDYIAYFQDNDSISVEQLDTLYYMYKLGGEASCKLLEKRFGNSFSHYSGNATAVAKIISNKSECDLYQNEDGGISYWAVLFQSRESKSHEDGSYIWRLRKELGEAISELEETGFFDVLIPKSETDIDRNTILYGPPGTGKTYSTAIYAVSICDGIELDDVKQTDYDQVIARYRKLIEEGRVVFTTFHQSYGYEEFIEGIKPVVTDTDDVKYIVEDGVFKDFCNKALVSSDVEINQEIKIWKIFLGNPDSKEHNSVKAECFNEGKVMFNWGKREDHEGEYAYYQIEHLQERVKVGDIVVSYAGNGSKIDGLGVVTGDPIYDETKSEYRWSRAVRWIEQNKVCDIKELNAGKTFDNDNLQELKRVKAQDLLKFYLTKNNASGKKNYVFVIDEINRGNISKVFGELITLIETTKRIGKPEEMQVKLPYSKKAFGVPDNVYILGTMNTADRSIALMDTALRRRFSFVEMMPDANVLSSLGIKTMTQDGVTLDVPRMLTVINKRIEFLYDREHTIGHAFFTKLRGNASLEQLREIYLKNIIPLLQEYFYEDYEKIQLVLGDNKKSSDNYKFIIRNSESAISIFNGSIQLDSVNSYKINFEAFNHLESYVEIYEKTGVDSI